MWDRLFQNFEKHIQVTPADKALVQSLFRHRRYRKHQYILQEGEAVRAESFVVKGCTRTYQVDEKGQEHILSFGPEDWWVGDLYSFLTGQPSAYNIDCYEDTEVLQITPPDLERLYAEAPIFERFFRIIVQNAFIALQRRVMTTISQPAAERYREFQQRYPHIEQRVPNHQIASYLGITPQSLSRIRRGNRK